MNEKSKHFYPEIFVPSPFCMGEWGSSLALELDGDRQYIVSFLLWLLYSQGTVLQCPLVRRLHGS
jgi:hypothetical protein